MKLQRYGKDGQPRNEFKDSDRDEHEAYVKRTGDQTWRPVKPVPRATFVPVKVGMPKKTTNNKK